MEWVYIIGLIGYYIYKAYSKGVEQAKDKPIKPIEQRKKEKTLDEIFKELMENAKKEQQKKPSYQQKIEPKKVLEEKKKDTFNKPHKAIVSKKEKEKEYDTVLHKHKDLASSIEYDDGIEKILHQQYDKIDGISSDFTDESNLTLAQIYNTESIQRRKAVQLLIKGKAYSPKDLFIAQTLFDTKF